MGVAVFLTWLEGAVEVWVPFASLLGVMAIGFIILEKSEAIAHIISQKLKKLWMFAELLLFVLVGAQVNIQVAWKAGLAGIAVIVAGLLFRSVGTYISLWGTDLTRREKLFCIVAYIPKATVQAAIGAVGIMTLGERILMESQKARILEICLWDFNRLYRLQRRMSGFLRIRQSWIAESALLIVSRNSGKAWACPGSEKELGARSLTRCKR